MATKTIKIDSELAGATVAAVLRKHMPDKSWNQIRRLVATRHVQLNGELWLDSARRVKEGDEIEVAKTPAPRASVEHDITIRHLDDDIVVVEKPAGISTVRHPAERDWSDQRRALVPTLDDLVSKQISRSKQARLRIVHRLDKATSGLVVFARSVVAERDLGKQFHAHSVRREYIAFVPGQVEAQRIETRLVRDRGDGRRGSTRSPNVGKLAVTHIGVRERLAAYTVLSCRLETGRTHQIRIHLAELGHPVCGELVYNRGVNGTVIPDKSSAPRLALHAEQLGFLHPTSHEELLWEMPLPADLQDLLDRLRRRRLS